MLNWNSDSSLMSEPNYVLVEGIDYDLPPGTPWRPEQEGPPLILKNHPHPQTNQVFKAWKLREMRLPDSTITISQLGAL